jgi:hypothetical protein
MRPRLASTNLLLPATTTGTQPVSADKGSIAYDDTQDKPVYKQADGTWVVFGAGAGGPPTGAAGGDLADSYPNPTVTTSAGLKSATTTVTTSAATAPTAGQVLTATSDTAANWQTPLANSSSLWNYRADTTTTAGYPGDGHIRWDNATQASSTTVRVAHLNSAGDDIDIFLALVTNGAALLIQDANDSTRYQKWTVSGTPTNTNPGTGTSFWTFPVTLVSSGGGNLPNNHQIFLTFASSTTPAGSAGGDLGSTYPNPTVIALHETGGPTKLTLGVIADTNVLQRSGSTVVGATVASFTYGTGRQPLWLPPAMLGVTPRSCDSEFDSDPGWLFRDFTNGAARTPSGAPDERTQNTPSSNVPKISFTQRKSYVRLQPPNIAAGYNGAYYYGTLESPTLTATNGAWYWAALGGQVGVNSTNGSRLGLALWADASGVPDNANVQWIGFSNDQSWHGHSVIANTDNPVGAVSGWNVSNRPWPYVAMFRKSAATEFYVFDDNGQFWCFGVSAVGPASYWVGLRVVNQDGVGASNLPWTVHECDFVRSKLGTTPPWCR